MAASDTYGLVPMVSFAKKLVSKTVTLLVHQSRSAPQGSGETCLENLGCPVCDAVCMPDRDLVWAGEAMSATEQPRRESIGGYMPDIDNPDTDPGSCKTERSRQTRRACSYDEDVGSGFEWCRHKTQFGRGRGVLAARFNDLYRISA